VVEQGPVGELFKAPRHPYTQALFAAAPGKDWDFARFRAA
jgi:peptide/nickel transport system ATP-binding protein